MIKRVAGILCVLAWSVFMKTYAKDNPIQPAVPPSYPIVLDEDNQRYLCVALLNTTEGAEQGLDVIRAAAKKGCNAAMITVRWDVVHEKTTTPSNWAQFDNQIKLCKELGLKIFVRVHLARCCNRNEGYWLESEASKDQQGRSLKEIFSMSHQPSVDKALGFVKEVCERYLPYLQEGRILCLAATTTTTQEAGYHYDGYVSDGTLNNKPYSSLYDYAPSSITGYRNWLKARYGNINKINETWKSDYSDISDITPITTDYPHPENKRWSDWYIYRHTMLKNFLDGVSRTAKGVSSAYKIINDFGSVFDGLSFRRATFAFKDLARTTDGTKINDAQYYPHSFSADLLRSNTSADKWIMNEAFREPNISQYGMQLMVNEHFERGCKLVNIVATSVNDIDWYESTIDLVANKWLNNPMTPIIPVQKMVVKLSELVKAGHYDGPGYMSRWNEKKVAGPVEVKLIEDLLGEPEINQPPVVNSPLKNYSITSGFDVSYPIPEDAFQDPDGSIEFYEVSGLPAGLTFDKNIIKGSTTQMGTYRITVKATDMYEASVSATFLLTITAQKAIAIDVYKAGNFQTRSLIRALRNNDTLNINTFNFSTNFIATSDISTKAIVMKLSGPVSQTRTETDAPFALFGDDGGTNLKVGNYQLILESYNATTIIPANGLGKSIFNFVVVNQRVNQAPIVVNKIADQQTLINRSFNYTVPIANFQDKDGQIAYIVFTGLPTGLRSSGWQIIGTPTKAGSYTVTAEVFDNENASVKTQFVLQVNAVNQAPIATKTIPDQVVIVQQSYDYDIPISLFEDIDGYIVRIVVQSVPAGLSFQNSKLSGKPAVVGEYRIVVKALDNEGLWGETSFRLTVKSIATNLSPIALVTIPNQKTTIGAAFSYTLPASLFRDPEGSAIRIEVPNLPSGLSFTNGIIVGIPTVAGEFKVTVQGFDNVGAFTEITFLLTITLSNNNVPPVVDIPIPDQNAVVGEPFSLIIPISNFRDPDGVLYGIIVRNLPSGLVYQSGEIKGTPTQVGDYTVMVRAIDNQGASVDHFFVIKVKETATGNSNFVFSLFKAGGSASRVFVRTIRNNDKISINTIPTFINVFVESSAAVDRIQFTMAGAIDFSFTDNIAPFGLFDDNGGFSANPGVYVLQVKGIKNNKVVGESTIQFELINDNSARNRMGEIEWAETETWVPSPNPFVNTLKIKLPAEYKPTTTTFSVIHLSGQSKTVSDLNWEEQQATLNLAPLSLPKGMYLLQIQQPDYPKKIIKILKAE